MERASSAGATCSGVPEGSSLASLTQPTRVGRQTTHRAHVPAAIRNNCRGTGFAPPLFRTRKAVARLREGRSVHVPCA